MVRWGLGIRPAPRRAALAQAARPQPTNTQPTNQHPPIPPGGARTGPGPTEPSKQLAYRVSRSQRVVLVDPQGVNNSLQRFDGVVSKIEASVARESNGQRLTQTWNPNPRDETCTVCDFRTFCPAPGNRYRGAPSAP